MGCGTAWAAPITLSEGTWGMPGASKGDLGAHGLSQLTGTAGIWGTRGSPWHPLLRALCSSGLQERSWTCCWLWGAPAHLLAPLRGPSSHRQLLRGIFRYQPCPICVSNVPGGGCPPLPAAVTHFLPPVLPKPLCSGCRGHGGSEQQPLPWAYPRIAGTSPGIWAGVSAGQRDLGGDSAL